MATFRNRDGKWQVRVRRQGYAAIKKSFITFQDAEKWARSIEVDLDKNTYTNTNLAEKTTFKEIIECNGQVNQNNSIGTFTPLLPC